MINTDSNVKLDCTRIKYGIISGVVKVKETIDSPAPGETTNQPIYSMEIPFECYYLKKIKREPIMWYHSIMN